ncbi:ATP-dependent RNA helicase [Diatrype stigma]|uniref:ATP-dependent RNA helicase n=1 Tax=Diatrype stigma TaxID=117547 RepID=A0AAN9V167_9PEZI
MGSGLHGLEGTKLLVCFIVLDALATASVVLRFYSISIQRSGAKLHDILCLVSLIMLFGYSAALLVGTVDGGIGLHISDVSAVELPIGLKSFFASQFMWAISICSFRVAILLLYLEVFGRARWFRWATWASVAIVCLFYVGALSTTLRLCSPIAYNWDRTIEGTCGNEGEAELAAATINMVLDVVIVAPPLPIIWGLKMRTGRKVAVSVTFGLGMSISAINLARIFEVLNCSLMDDFTYCTLDSAILTVAEMALGIMVASVPRMGHIFRRDKSKGSSPGSSGQALHYKRYLGSHTTGDGRASERGDHVRLQSSDTVDLSGACSQKSAYGSQDTASNVADEEMRLELGHIRAGTNVSAAYWPEGSDNDVAGIKVARDFRVTEN